MKPDSTRLREALRIDEVEPELYDRAFIATTQYVPWPKAYGGDMVAQAAAAAMATVDRDRALHSAHSYFLRPVDIGETVRYEVELVRDGRSYSTRQVRALQNGKAVYLSSCSFQVPETGPEHRLTMPDVPAPESLPSAADVLADRDDEASRYWAGGRSIDHRHVPGPIYLAVEGEPLPHQAVWLRSFDALPDDENLHRAALAYACDYTILEPALRSLSTPWAQHGLVTASLDHSMWFHRFGRIDEWILYAQELDSLQSNRALNLGRFFTRSGVHLATVAQEGMIRRSTASAH